MPTKPRATVSAVSWDLWLDELRPAQDNISRAHEDCQKVVTLGAAA